MPHSVSKIRGAQNLSQPKGFQDAHRAGVVDKAAVASIRIDRATFSEALADAAALGGADIAGDRDVVTELFASLTVFDTAALIEPRSTG